MSWEQANRKNHAMQGSHAMSEPFIYYVKSGAYQPLQYLHNPVYAFVNPHAQLIFSFRLDETKEGN